MTRQYSVYGVYLEGGRALVRESGRGDDSVILTSTRAEISGPKSSQSYERARALRVRVL